MLYPVILTGAWLVWHIVFRIQVIGRENLKKIQTAGFILAPTHISAIDPVFIAIARFWGKRMVVFAKKELFEISAMLRNIERAGDHVKNICEHVLYMMKGQHYDFG